MPDVFQGFEDRLAEGVERAVAALLAGIAPEAFAGAAGEPRLEQEIGELVEAGPAG